MQRSRPSPGLAQFWEALEGRESARLLDLAGASQSTVSFVASLGHSLYSDDLLRSLDAYYGEGHAYLEHHDARRGLQFLDHTLDFPANHFDGVLVWDVLEFLAEPLLSLTVERIYRVVRPGGVLLALFHTEERPAPLPLRAFRVEDRHTLSLAGKGERRAAQPFSSRLIEKLFRDFHTVKFFLARDEYREVFVRR